jgi:hypothetical protein
LPKYPHIAGTSSHRNQIGGWGRRMEGKKRKRNQPRAHQLRSGHMGKCVLGIPRILKTFPREIQLVIHGGNFFRIILHFNYGLSVSFYTRKSRKYSGVSRYR